jgi:diguanylate cyclase (GGDEF)-like protein
VVAPASASPNPLAAVDLAQEDLGHWLNQARQLQVGEWVLLPGEDGQAQPLKLAWVATDRTEYVFVNRKGLKAVALGPVEIAEQLRGGQATVLGERDKPVVDRAMQDMLQHMSQQLVFQATHDQLTGLVNRKEFGKRLEQALLNAKRDAAEHVLCHMDLDQFKVVNMVCGHDAGDALLREVAHLLEAQLPEGGILARLGDDEFSVLLGPCSHSEGAQVAERQRIAVQDYRFVWEGKRYSVGASIGLVPVNQQSPGAAELLQHASSACDTAKEAGGNRIHTYQADDAELRRRQGVMQWLTRIARALDDDRLQLRCQQIAPVVPAAGPSEVHYEILLSFRDEEGRLTAPGEFIEAAELYHRMADVDRWVIRKVFRWMAERRNRLDQFGGFAINLSGNSLNDPNFSTFILEQLAAADIPAEMVCFEITETAAIANIGLAADFIREIKRTGCRFSLDDFGSGLSSYSYLKHLPVDFLKIDGMFVRDIVNNANDFAVVKSINEIGHFMGMKTIAEHVESAEILERLRQIGVDYAQGNGVERPRLLAAY